VTGPASPLDAILAAGGTVVVPGLLDWLGYDRRPDPDFQASIDSGLTESFEDYCTRTDLKET
jgi:hypothetical protein